MVNASIHYIKNTYPHSHWATTVVDELTPEVVVTPPAAHHILRTSNSSCKIIKILVPRLRMAKLNIIF